MKFNVAAAAAGAAFLVGGVSAEDQKVVKDESSSSSSSSVAESSTASIPPLPTFTVSSPSDVEKTPFLNVQRADAHSQQPSNIKAPFLEQFTDDWETRWKPSHAKKDTKGSEEEWAYVGEWAVEEPIVYKGMEGDKGLVVKNAAAHHAISAKFPKKIDPKGKTLVVQYEVKLQGEFPLAKILMSRFLVSLRWLT